MQANAEHLSAELPLEGEGRVLYPASAKAGAGLQVLSLTLLHQEHISVLASLSFPLGFIAASGTLGKAWSVHYSWSIAHMFTAIVML